MEPKRENGQRAPLYHLYRSIHARCYNPDVPAYATTGGVGIGVSESWRKSFDTFVRDMGHPPSPEHELRRIDPDGGFDKFNCKWMLRKEAVSANAHLVTIDGVTQSHAAWAKSVGITPAALCKRLKKGVSFEEALSFKSGERPNVLSGKDHPRYKHGMSESAVYAVWTMMIQRCTNPNNAAYRNYGGRGIKICADWLERFEYFLEDMGEPPEGHELDRTDNDGPYSKENCHWIPAADQASNKRSNRLIWIGGESAILARWLEMYGTRRETFYKRLNRGWTIEQAITYGKRPHWEA
jgi:hypothetical protein